MKRFNNLLSPEGAHFLQLNARRPSPVQKVRESSLFIATQLFKQFPNIQLLATLFMGFCCFILLLMLMSISLLFLLLQPPLRCGRIKHEFVFLFQCVF